MSDEQLSLLGDEEDVPEAAEANRCESCGGRLDVDPAPANAQGCACALRREVRAQRESIERVARAGKVSAEMAAALTSGTWVPWVP